MLFVAVVVSEIWEGKCRLAVAFNLGKKIFCKKDGKVEEERTYQQLFTV